MLTIIPAIIPGVTLLLVLLLFFIIAANRWHNGQKKLEQHARNGDFVSPESGLFSDVIFLDLKAKHFINTDFVNVRDCAIAKCLKDKFPHCSFNVGPVKVLITYSHLREVSFKIHKLTCEGYIKTYEAEDFHIDKAISLAALHEGRPETQIRRIKLVKL